MKNRFKKYLMYDEDKNVNSLAFESAQEAFSLFKELYDTHYGSIKENGNLISIHTGGWSENEILIHEFKDTAFWWRFHQITAKGGHYYFNTDSHANMEWNIIGGIDGQVIMSSDTEQWNKGYQAATQQNLSFKDGYEQAKKEFQLPLPGNERDLLISFAKEMQRIGFNEMDNHEKVVDSFIENKTLNK